jgi:transcriptional regulator with XRE-family HTH domain
MSAKMGIPHGKTRRDKQNSRLYVLRMQKHISQRELADRAGVSRNTIMRIENGDCLPSTSVIIRLCAALNVSITELME